MDQKQYEQLIQVLDRIATALEQVATSTDGIDQQVECVELALAGVRDAIYSK